MNCLEKYRSKLIREINRELGVILDRPEEDAIHDFRVGLKRLTALYFLLNEIDPDLNAKQLLKPYRALFKSIGNIRDVHIAVELITSLEDISPQDAGILARAMRLKAQRDYRLFQQLSQSDRRLLIKMPTIQSTGISARALNRQKPVVLNQLLTQILASTGKMSAKRWHQKRILLKRYHHVLDAFCFCPGHSLDETELKQIKILEQLLGDWHDRVVTAELLGSLTGVETQMAAALAVMERQDKLLLGAARIYLRKFVLWHQNP